MATKQSEKPERPRLRQLFPERGPKWLNPDPARIAPVGGIFFAAVAMIYFVILQLLGKMIPPLDVFLGVAKTFVVAYAGTGLFAYLVLRIIEREFPEEDPRAGLGLFEAEEDTDSDDGEVVVPGMNDDMVEGEENA